MPVFEARFDGAGRRWVVSYRSLVAEAGEIGVLVWLPRLDAWKWCAG